MTDAAPDSLTAKSGRLGIFSWCLFDWANSSFPTIVWTFVFSRYVVSEVAAEEQYGAAVWSFTIAASGIVVALFGPVLGAVSDQSPRRKPWIAAFVPVTVICAALLWHIEPEPQFLIPALLLVAVGGVAFEFAVVANNSMLPEIVPDSHIGRVSGWGWGLGYVGSIFCLSIGLLAFVQADRPLFGLSGDKEELETVRALGPLVAVWYGLFALPLLAFTPDRPGQGGPIAPFARRVIGGFRQLAQTIRQIRVYAQHVRFLIASMLYRDGLALLFSHGAIFAAIAHDMDTAEVIQFAIGLNVTAGLGALAFSWVDDWIGSKPTILIALAGLIAAGAAILLVADKQTFMILGLVLGVFVGPAQAASRTLMARIAPPEMRGEFFGLYALAGKATAFLGPLAVGWITLASDLQTAMWVIIAFFAIGGLILLTVRERQRT